MMSIMSPEPSEPRPQRPPTAMEIVHATSRTTGVPVTNIMGPSRVTEVVQARRIAMFLARELCRLSYLALGRIFGRDHSSVIIAVRAVGEAPSHSVVGIEVSRVREALAGHITGAQRLVGHSGCLDCNELRATNETLRRQLADAYALLDGAR